MEWANILFLNLGPCHYIFWSEYVCTMNSRVWTALPAVLCYWCLSICCYFWFSLTQIWNHAMLAYACKTICLANHLLVGSSCHQLVIILMMEPSSVTSFQHQARVVFNQEWICSTMASSLKLICCSFAILCGLHVTWSKMFEGFCHWCCFLCLFSGKHICKIFLASLSACAHSPYWNSWASSEVTLTYIPCVIEPWA